MPTKLQREDREFARSVGIKAERDNCDMCELYEVERSRRLGDLISSAACIARQKADLRLERQRVHTWQLATFAATLLMLLFAFSTIHGGVK